MKLTPIINTLMETDAYKFSMGQCIFHQFNSYTTTWEFRCRNQNVKFTPEMIDEIEAQIKHYCTLRFSEDELHWLGKNLPWIHKDYLDYLRLWRPRVEEIRVTNENPYNDCGLGITTHGTWLNTSMYEIAILAIVNEVYFSFTVNASGTEHLLEFEKRTFRNFEKLSNMNIHPVFSEFGLRRRFTGYTQDWLVEYLSKCAPGSENFVGTSNVNLARKHNVKAVGTQAHEFIMCVGQGNPKHNPAYSNWYAMDAWIREYSVMNGIVLADTIGTDVFLRDFGLTYATLFSGVRHDSGDPLQWGDKIIKHYEKLGIDPNTKTLLFSDSLNFDKVYEIERYFEGRCKTAYGIGTFLSNPFPNPLNIVMKVVYCNGLPVAKLSDTPGKGMCQDENYLKYLQRCIDWRMKGEA